MWREVRNVYLDEQFPYDESLFCGLKVTANMGKNYAPCVDDEIHLDSVLSYAVLQSLKAPDLNKTNPRVFPIPIKILALYDELPLLAVTPLMPNETLISSEYWHKRFPVVPVQRFCKSPNTPVTRGQYKEYRIPVRVNTCDKLECYCIGDKEAITKLLGHIKFLGKKASQGKGFVLSWDVEVCQDVDDGFILKRRKTPFTGNEKKSCGVMG